MGIPLFMLPSGCSSEGFDHPCVADRWGLGGALLGAGLGVAAGGVLTLTLPL